MSGRALTVTLILLVVAGCSRAPDGGEDRTAAPDRCAGIGDPVERFVCTDVDLRAMDADLDRLYQRVLARADHTAKASLRNEHAAWERGLNECLELAEGERRACLDERYNAHLKELAARL
jgi:uncharacterized protein